MTTPMRPRRMIDLTEEPPSERPTGAVTASHVALTAVLTLMAIGLILLAMWSPRPTGEQTDPQVPTATDAPAAGD